MKINKLKIELLLLVVLIQGFTGCSGLKYPTVHHDAHKVPKYIALHNPKLNVVSVVEIGENIYSKSFLFYDNTSQVTLLEPAIGSGFGVYVDTTKSIDIQKGLLKSWAKIGKDNIKTFCFENTMVCLTDLDSSGYFTHFGAGAQVGSYELDNPAKYKVEPTPAALKENSFKYIVLYQGLTDNKIKISFREFKNNMARPAFTQEIDYELDKDGSTIIGFKGLRVEVIEVTNMDIKYKVIKDYN